MSNGIYINLTVTIWIFGIVLLTCIISGLIMIYYSLMKRGNNNG